MNKNIILYVTLGTMLMLLLGIVYSYSMFRLEIESIYDANSVESGLPYMFVLLFYSLFMMIGGILYSRYSTFKVAIVGTLFVGLGFILASFSSSIFTITITYGVIIGTGIGILYGLPLRIVSQMNHPRLGLLTGITLLGFGLSPLIFAPVINQLITRFDLSHTFFILGIIYLLLLPALVYYLVKQDTSEKVIEKLTYPLLKDKKFISLYVLFFISTFIGLTFIGFTGNIGSELLGLTESSIAIYVGIFAIFNGVGRPLFGWINDKIGFKNAAMISFISIIVVTLLHYMFSTSILVFIISFIIFYLNFGGWLSLAPSATIALFGKEKYSKNYGLMFTAYGLGAIFGTLISGFLVQSFDLRALFLLMSALALFGLVFVNWQFKNK